MTPTADRGGRARLFVALELPPGLADPLLAWRAPVLAAHAWLRPVRPESLHLTLCFLGDQPVAAIEKIAGLGASAAGSCPGGPLTLGAAVWLPRRQPRVLAIELNDGDGWLAVLQERLARALAEAGRYRPDHPRFLAHVTVARVRRGGSRPAPPGLGPPPAARAGGAVVSLMRSELGRGPARYERLAQWQLPGETAASR